MRNDATIYTFPAELLHFILTFHIIIACRLSILFEATLPRVRDDALLGCNYCRCTPDITLLCALYY